MAVDRAALEQAVDAWATAPPAEEATRFATAETVRWLEWGANAFSQLLLGLTAVLHGLLLAGAGPPPGGPDRPACSPASL